MELDGKGAGRLLEELGKESHNQTILHEKKSLFNKRKMKGKLEISFVIIFKSVNLY